MAALDLAQVVESLMNHVNSTNGKKHNGNDRRQAEDAIGKLHKLMKDDMEKINSLIIDRIFSEVGIIPELARHIIDSGGKRLRPLITITTARLCGYQEAELHVKLAASVELMHTATLLHDDVVDGQAHRRGKKTARMIWGNQSSVLVGDFLLGRAFKMMVECGSLRALEILSHAASVIAEGEVLQLASTARDPNITFESHYLKIIESKTAELFAAAAELGAVVAGVNAEKAAALRS
jgi:octaprenyl-diphosphate synthase